MKKTGNTKDRSKQGLNKSNDSGELKKVTKLKPLKAKEKKNWKNNLGDEDEDFDFDDELDLDTDFDDEDEDLYDDEY